MPCCSSAERWRPPIATVSSALKTWSRAAELNRQSQTVPVHLQNSISETQNEVRRLRDAMSAMDERMIELRERFELDLERYRSLTHRGD